MPPLPPQRDPRAISLELALGDGAVDSSTRLSDREAALLRLCALSDVNPVRRRRRVVAFSGVVTLWAEAFVIVAAHAPIGLL
jgi:hypothetical protein